MTMKWVARSCPSADGLLRGFSSCMLINLWVLVMFRTAEWSVSRWIRLALLPPVGRTRCASPADFGVRIGATSSPRCAPADDHCFLEGFEQRSGGGADFLIFKGTGIER